MPPDVNMLSMHAGTKSFQSLINFGFRTEMSSVEQRLVGLPDCSERAEAEDIDPGSIFGL